MDDPRFANNIDRVENRDELKAEIESALMKIDGEEIGVRLAEAGLAAGPIHNTQQVVDHPHTHHREMNIEKDWYKMAGTPIKLSRTPGALRHLPPKFGAHSQEILAEFGFSETEIESLLASNTVLVSRQR
jgi:formyl-CoA transferase